MSLSDKDSIDLQELVDLLNEDRSLLLEKIDQGYWPDLRYDLAALERELGQLLTRATEKIEEKRLKNSSN
tara:strand:+ start:556 stop:765 length:210 start_codon:yes stop_codon:yes gene_type:complete